MNHVTAAQNTVVWIFLVVASLATVWFAEDRTWFGDWTVAVVLLVAVIKARAIVQYYMEIKFAPWQLKMLFEAWVAVSFGVILGFWYFS